VPIGGGPQLPQPLGIGQRVVVAEHGEVALELAQTGVEGPVLAAARLDHQVHGQAIGKGGGDCGGAVVAAVVDEDELPPAGRRQQPRVGVEHPWQGRPSVVGRDENRQHAAVPIDGDRLRVKLRGGRARSQALSACLA
jgi:hypothetical protein